MSIEQTIYDVIELSRHSKVPFLLMSNPGYGKTTIINKWAKENGYHVEVLIGSRFTPEEIMGYQVNEPGATSLVHKNPKWYDNVMEYEAKGIPTLLFEDEISTCPDYVQGALLDLNFSRHIGNGSALPEDCLVMAAANYASNLPSSMNIITPNINRFCVINLLEGMSNLDIMNEFLTPSAGAVARKYNPLSLEQEIDFQKAVREGVRDLLLKYSEKDSSIGYINMENDDISGVYEEASGRLYNILTGRSMSYLARVIKTMSELNIVDKKLSYQVGAGLVGLGTNNFNEKQAEGWRKNVSSLINRLVVDFNSALASKKLDLNGTIYEVVQRFLQETEKSDIAAGNIKSLDPLIERIKNEYGDIITTTEGFLNGKKDDKTFVAHYISDLDGIEELFNYIEKVDPSNPYVSELKKIHMSHLAYYCELTDVSLSSRSLPDTYGVDAPKTFNELRVVKLSDTERNKKRGVTYLQVARKRAGDRQIFFEVNLKKAKSLAMVNCSKTFAKDDIEEIISLK